MAQLPPHEQRVQLLKPRPDPTPSIPTSQMGTIPPPSPPTLQRAGTRNTPHRRPQIPQTNLVSTITDKCWRYMTTVYAIPILQQNIIAVQKCPDQFKTQWRSVLATVDSAMKSTDANISKGAEITLALLPNMLFRSPNARERDLSTRAKWTARFRKFWSGDFRLQVGDIPNSSAKHSNQPTYASPGINLELTIYKRTKT